jgi:Domain of unknown function (DUF4190)
MAAAHPETPTRERTEERASASPMDGHAPPTATAGTRPGKAVTAMVLGIISVPAMIVPIAGLVLGVIAIILGLTARNHIKRHNLQGGSQALIGVVLGSIGVLLSIANMVATAVIMTS